MEEIADAAGVSRRTAFRYFPNKEELVFPDHAELVDKFDALLQPREGETAFETVRRGCLALARNYVVHREHFVAQHLIVRDEPALMGYELRLDRDYEALIMQALGRGRANRRATIWAGAILGAVRSTLREWLEGNGTADLVRMGRDLFAMFEEGINPS